MSKQQTESKLMQSCGVVISDSKRQTPNISDFSFIITDPTQQKIKQGQYCITTSHEGFVIGRIEQIYISNDYFQNVMTVKNFDKAQVDLQNYFPSEQWECHIGLVTVLGLIPEKKKTIQDLTPDIFGKFDKVVFPVTPGNKVYKLEGEALYSFLGLTHTGLNIGSLKNYNIPIQLDINRLFNKHLAILAQSGAGKSYLMSVLIEELLLRPRSAGSPAMILLDVHGEYHFNWDSDKTKQEKNPLYGKINRYNGSFLQIGVPDLSEYDFRRYQPSMSLAQLRELRKAINLCRYPKKALKDDKDSENREVDSKNANNEQLQKKSLRKSRYSRYDINDLINTINNQMEMNTNVREALVGWLSDLNRLGIFGKRSNPPIKSIAKVNQLVIIDFSSIISMKKKSILLHFFSSQLFQFRRQNKIPPFVFFLEEAHNFIPEKNSKWAIAKSIIETMAREGRKFFAQLVLVSQRPVRLSTTVLSQCNSQIILRITNPYDLQHVKETSETLTHEAIKAITTLPTGNALILGPALNFPIFIQVRQKKMQVSGEEITLLEKIQQYNEPDFQELVGNTSTAIKPSEIHFIQEDFIESDF